MSKDHSHLVGQGLGQATVTHEHTRHRGGTDSQLCQFEVHNRGCGSEAAAADSSNPKVTQVTSRRGFFLVSPLASYFANCVSWSSSIWAKGVSGKETNRSTFTESLRLT